MAPRIQVLHVQSIKSVLSSADIDSIYTKFKISKDIPFLVPSEDDRACAPPDGYITIYEAHLNSGLRIPLALELRQIFVELEVPIARLHANAIRYLCNLCIFFRLRGLTLNIPTVNVVFKFSHIGDWISLTPRELNISGVIYESVKSWKDRFFFLKASFDMSFSTVWGNVPSSFSGKLDEDDEKSVRQFTDLIRDNINSFSDKERLLSPEILSLAKWEPFLAIPATNSYTPKRKRKIHQSRAKGSSSKRRVIHSSPTASSTDSGVPISDRMEGMKKSAEKSVSPSIDLTPTTQAQGTEETADPTFDAPIPDKNIGSEVAIFSGLTPLSEIHNEPSSEQISNVLVVDDYSRSAHIPDRIQRAASEAPIENPLISSSAVDEIPTVVADPPRPGKEINIPEVPVSSSVGVRAEWMNTPTSSHPSPGSPNTSASRIPLNEISLRARFIQDERLNEIMRIGIHQRRLWIGQLQREVQTLSQNRVDPMVFEEMRNKMEAATVEAQQYKDRNIILEADLQKAKDEIQSMSFNLSESQKELGSAQQEIANLNSEMLTRFRPEEIGSALVARFQEGIHFCQRIALMVDPQFPVDLFDQRNTGINRRSDLRDSTDRGESSSHPSGNVL